MVISFQLKNQHTNTETDRQTDRQRCEHHSALTALLLTQTHADTFNFLVNMRTLQQIFENNKNNDQQ